MKLNIKQLKWILSKALSLVEKFEKRSMSDADCDEFISDIEKIVNDSKGNEYCRKIMLDVAECIDREKTEDKRKRKNE